MDSSNKKKTIKVLSLPSRHPYMKKFNCEEIKFVNPDSDFFVDNLCSAFYLQSNHPPASYDVVHIHFSFDRIPLTVFENLLKYFHKNKKPIIWTCHDQESQRIKNYGRGKYQKLLFKYADQIISPTYGCARWLESKFGKHKNKVEIIPLGFMADPQEVKELNRKVKKDRNLFTILIGDFRENKEVVQSVINFLQCTALKKTKLQLIFKPISLFNYGYEKLKMEMLIFYFITHHPRITTISLPDIPNRVIIKAFLSSHAVILPYKWGTHSGQIELAKDCGCWIAAPNIGYYKEQWDKIFFWNISDKNYSEYPIRYTRTLVNVYHRESLKPMGLIREREFEKIFKDHLVLYRKVLKSANKP